MRGVVSLAAALAIPITMDNGMAFPQRNLILFITFIVILVTLVGQGLTLPQFIKRSGAWDNIVTEESERDDRQKVKQGLKENALQFLKNKRENEPDHEVNLPHLVRFWEKKENASDEGWMNEKTKAVFMDLLENQRQYLEELNKDPKIDEETIRHAVYQIDLEEERIKLLG